LVLAKILLDAEALEKRKKVSFFSYFWNIPKVQTAFGTCPSRVALKLLSVQLTVIADVLWDSSRS
jgi:hypothetical protein